MEIGDTNNSVGNGNTRSLLLCVVKWLFLMLYAFQMPYVFRELPQRKEEDLDIPLQKEMSSHGNARPWREKQMFLNL